MAPLPRIVETKWMGETETTGTLQVRLYNEGTDGPVWLHVSADKEVSGRYPYDGDYSSQSGQSWTVAFSFQWALDQGCGVRVCCGYYDGDIKHRSDTYGLRLGTYTESVPPCPYNHVAPKPKPFPIPGITIFRFILPAFTVPFIRQLRDYVFTPEMHRKLHPLI